MIWEKKKKWSTSNLERVPFPHCVNDYQTIGIPELLSHRMGVFKQAQSLTLKYFPLIPVSLICLVCLLHATYSKLLGQ